MPGQSSGVWPRYYGIYIYMRTPRDCGGECNSIGWFVIRYVVAKGLCARNMIRSESHYCMMAWIGSRDAVGAPWRLVYKCGGGRAHRIQHELFVNKIEAHQIKSLNLINMWVIIFECMEITNW